jgi:hypothetical protein
MKIPKELHIPTIVFTLLAALLAGTSMVFFVLVP